MRGWLDDWTTGWPDDQMTGWLDDHMTKWMEEWAGWLDGWMTGWPDDRKLRRRLTVWYILNRYLIGYVGQPNHINVSLIHWYYAWAWVMILCIISPAIFAQVPRELRYDVENNSLTFLLKFLRPCRISNDALWSHKLF